MMTRKEFVGGLAAFATVGSAVGAVRTNLRSKTVPAWRKGRFQAHFIYNGTGESVFLVYPDGRSYAVVDVFG